MYQVLKFQSTAAKSNASKAAAPVPDATRNTSDGGRIATTLYATRPVERSTPMKFQIPDQITARVGGKLLV
jgi:hypothetical protein